MKSITKKICAASMVLSLAACTGTPSASAPSASTGTPVEPETASVVRTTASGPVKGAEANGVMTWYGIPYAAAPVGELRWAAPVDPAAWTDELDCSAPGDKFLQAGTNDAGEAVAVGSEDCLKLDVYATGDAKDKPVLVFIHGGNNQTGTSQEIPGTELVVSEDCVYVSLNYRLGILGFNCLPALQTEDGSTGNYTLLDIAKALDWVKANISEFGGDPNNITISGFSAGGRDVIAMLTSPLFKGKFQKAISYSGGMTMADVDASASQIAWAVAPIAVEDGKAADAQAAHDWLLTDGADVKEYLYSIPSEKLCMLMSNAGIRMSVFPHLYTDGVTLPKEGFDTTDFNNVPVIMLTGSTEFSFFSAWDAYFSSDEMKALSEEELAAATTFAVEYGSDMYGISNGQCTAQKFYGTYNAPMYLCEIAYGSKDSKSLLPTVGAFHGIFVPMLSSVNGYTSVGDFSGAGYQDMAGIYNGYIKNFLKTGDPNGEGLATWNAWTTDAPETMYMDADDTKAEVGMKNITTSYEDIIKAMEADTTVSEENKLKVIAHVMNGRWFSEAMDKHYNNENLWK